MTVEPQWTDYNGHMNMAYYNVLFDRGADQAFDAMGLGAAYAKERKLTIYTAEIHVCYLRELHQGSQVTVSLQVVDHDDKRIHFYEEMRHTDGWLAATSETLCLHIDMTGPKVTPFPPDSLARLQAIAAAHAAMTRPERVGRSIGIARKS